MNVDFGEFAQIAQTYSGCGIDQPARRRDNEHTANSLHRAGEGIGVSKFAAKIKSAEKGEDLTHSRPFAAAQSPGQIKLRALAQNHARALPACVRGRKQKDAVWFDFFHAELSAEELRASRQSTRRARTPRFWGPAVRGKTHRAEAAQSTASGPRWLRRRAQNPKFTI